MIRFGVLTISDRSSQGKREDYSGIALVNEIAQSGWNTAITKIIPDEQDIISGVLREWVDSGDVDVILTTGGTGFSARDVTPEATQAVIERPAPGISEAIRAKSLQITPHAMLSRAVAGITGKTLIINLPGSPSGAVESLQVVKPVLAHAVELLINATIPDSHHKPD
jgi:molybdopterin adenylyltransferase